MKATNTGTPVPFTVGAIVKFKTPMEDEDANDTYFIKELRGSRVAIVPTEWDFSISPVQTVLASDLELVPKPIKYTLKLGGMFFTSKGHQRGFFSHGVAGSYAFTIEEARELKKTFGGEVVEVLHGEGLRVVEGNTVE